MLFFNKKPLEEVIIEEITNFAKKYDFDVYRKPDNNNTYYLVNNSYIANPRTENKLYGLQEKLNKKKEVTLLTINPTKTEEKHELGECIYKRT